MIFRIGKLLAVGCAAPLIFACSQDGSVLPADNSAQVNTSGKSDVGVADLPDDVAAAARAAQPDLTIASAEAEVRDGRRYFDVGGTLPDGSEIELDIMQDGDTWRVVETQRDIAFAAAPEPVREAALATDRSLKPSRVIESRQEDGIVVYELFSPAGGDPQGKKVEVKWDGSTASVLTQEWQH